MCSALAGTSLTFIASSSFSNLFQNLCSSSTLSIRLPYSDFISSIDIIPLYGRLFYWLASKPCILLDSCANASRASSPPVRPPVFSAINSSNAFISAAPRSIPPDYRSNLLTRKRSTVFICSLFKCLTNFRMFCHLFPILRRLISQIIQNPFRH